MLELLVVLDDTRLTIVDNWGQNTIVLHFMLKLCELLNDALSLAPDDFVRCSARCLMDVVDTTRLIIFNKSWQKRRITDRSQE